MCENTHSLALRAGKKDVIHQQGQFQSTAPFNAPQAPASSVAARFTVPACPPRGIRRGTIESESDTISVLQGNETMTNLFPNDSLAKQLPLG
jgi:hypothetical protein